MSDAEVNAPKNASSDDETWTDETISQTSAETWGDPTERSVNVLITEEVIEDEIPETTVVSAGPFSTSWRVVSSDRLPAYLTATGLVIMGIIDPPVAIGAAIIYEGVRRLNNSYREMSR